MGMYNKTTLTLIKLTDTGLERSNIINATESGGEAGNESPNVATRKKSVEFFNSFC